MDHNDVEGAVELAMTRSIGTCLCALALAACTSLPRASPAPATPPGSGASFVRSALPSPTAVACQEVDVALQSMPVVVLQRASEPVGEPLVGLNGSGTLGDVVVERGNWHQPPPLHAMNVSRGEGMRVAAFVDTEPDALPLCLASATLDAAPFSPIAVAPTASALLQLPSIGPLDGGVAASRAPAQAGEWVVRVVLTFATDPRPSRQESFFRLRVDAPAPQVGGRASAPVACGPAGNGPPRAYLRVNGGAWIAGQGGSFTWGGMAGDGPAPGGIRVVAEPGAALSLKIEDDQCAAWWAVSLAPTPPAGQEQEAFVDLIPTRPGYDNPGSANRFALDTIPPGDWVVAAGFEFADADGNVRGQTIHAWNVVVP